MNKKQTQLVQEFVEKHGDVKVVERPNMAGLVQLQLGDKVSKNEGISLHWLTGFERHFKNISIAVSAGNDDFCMYITMFCKA